MILYCVSLFAEKRCIDFTLSGTLHVIGIFEEFTHDPTGEAVVFTLVVKTREKLQSEQ